MRKKTRHIILFLIAAASGFSAFAQYSHYTGISGMQEVLNARLYTHGARFHPDVQPYYLKEISAVENFDSIFNYKIPKETKFYKTVLTKNLINYYDGEVFIAADPLIDAVGGFDLSGKKAVFESGIGARLNLNLYKKVFAGGSIMYYQSSFPQYIDDKITAQRAVPGHNYAYKSALGGYNYLDYEFYLSYNFLKYFTLEAGFGKNFWGDGYRSLFLSEAAYNYPYLKLTTNVWNIKLVNLYTNFKDMSGIYSTTKWKNMTNKFGAFHYLSWDISKRVNFGFFESIIWQGKSGGSSRGFDVAYLNPIIFLRPIEFQRGSPDNSLLGISLRVKVGKKTSFYGQLLIDDIILGEVKKGIINRFKRIRHPEDNSLVYGFWTNKQAWQIGVKSYDLFKIKNFSALLEFNFARPYTYAHRVVAQNYGHYNQPLAHPGGANFMEACLFLRYNYQRWFFELHANYTVTGLDSVNSDVGQDIYKPAWDAYDASVGNVVLTPYFNVIGQGIKTRIGYYSLNVAYLLNPKNNLRLVLNYYYRSSNSKLLNSSANVISLGIKMSVPDRHYDY
ncbi:MAG TPA: hypothetical protein PKN48_15750 [Bacteroidales bacterium]|nr:hypothetical protein [Bacteroidales bacterium]